MASSSHSVRIRKRKPRPYKLDENYGLSAEISLACDRWFQRRGISDDWTWLNLKKAEERNEVINYEEQR